ncbi:MAG: SDR family oxidoreductase [Acidimicrobiia bacterium]|nr:SDR family oxidoreductase [Acidimicrobiia bacterium]
MLENKTIAVIGVGPGLGGEVATGAVRDGANVVIAARTEAKLIELADQLDPSGARVHPCRIDVADPDAGQTLVEAATDRFGGIDALVQVAAVDSVMGGVLGTDLDAFESTYRVNVAGPLRIIQAVAPVMEQGGGGSVVLIGSQSAHLAQILQTAYAASKGAMESAMVHLAAELGPLGIRVNTVIPTWMWGPPVQAYVQWQAGERDVPEDDIKAEIMSRMVLDRIPADEDVAEAALFFCSDRARSITGQSLMVNAGEIMG